MDGLYRHFGWQSVSGLSQEACCTGETGEAHASGNSHFLNMDTVTCFQMQQRVASCTFAPALVLETRQTSWMERSGSGCASLKSHTRDGCKQAGAKNEVVSICLTPHFTAARCNVCPSSPVALTRPSHSMPVLIFAYLPDNSRRLRQETPAGYI